MEDVPRRFEKELLGNEEIPVSDWVRQALDKAQKLEVASHERDLASKLIQKALDIASTGQYSFNILLAASFDLFVAAQYYKAVTHTGWYYCPKGTPALFYPFTNVCPRCMLAGEFHFEEANKPESGAIGQATSRLLSVFLSQLFERTGRGLQIYRGSEPVDILIHDKSKNVVLLAEIKAAPLTTLALAVASDEMIETGEDGEPTPITIHSQSNNPFLHSLELSLLMPLQKENKNWYRLVNIGKVDIQDKNWSYKGIERALEQDSRFFADYIAFWLEAFESYKETFMNWCSPPDMKKVIFRGELSSNT